MKTPYINLDDALKATLFDDEDAEERLRESGMTGRQLRKLRGPNRTRKTWRRDFGRRRCEFVRGRSIPVIRQAVGVPNIFKFSVGDAVLFGQKAQRPRYVIGIDYRHGTLTVPIHDEAYGRLLSLLVAP